MTIVRRGSAKTLHGARLAWLRDNPGMLHDVPGINEDVTDAGRVALDLCRMAMLAAGVLGGHPSDTQRDTIRRLASELRGEHVAPTGW